MCVDKDLTLWLSPCRKFCMAKMLCGHVFSLEKKQKLVEHQDGKTGEAEGSFAGLQRKRQDRISTPHCEEAKWEPRTLMLITGKSAWLDKGASRDDRNMREHPYLPADKVVYTLTYGTVCPWQDWLSAAGSFVMVRVTAENGVWMVSVTFWLYLKAVAKMRQGSKRLILTFNQ